MASGDDSPNPIPIIPLMSQRGEHIDEPGYPGENIQKDVENPQFP
jgi:hypothetical protein